MNTKRKRVGMAFVVLFGLLAMAGIGLAVVVADDIRQAPSCPYCGMDRSQYSHSRMWITNEDGKKVGTCAIRCTVVELDGNPDGKVKSIEVGDYDTRTLIDARKAFWVIGGNKKGVMTRRAKWAFGTKEAAEKFVKENGGTLATYDEAFLAAREDLKSGGRGGMRAGAGMGGMQKSAGMGGKMQGGKGGCRMAGGKGGMMQGGRGNCGQQGCGCCCCCGN